MRAVLDVNVVISALLSPRGAPARLLRLWLEGAFELVCSPRLLAELERALGYPKLRSRIGADEAAAVVELLRSGGELLDDPEGPPPLRSGDPGDDYLIALAAAARAVIVSGDRALLERAGELPVWSPRELLDQLDPDLLRRGLQASQPVEPYSTPTFPMGARADLDLGKALALAAAMEDEEVLRKLERAK